MEVTDHSFYVVCNCRRCIIGAVSETNMGGVLKSGCGQCACMWSVVYVSECACLCVYPLRHMR